MAGDVRALCVAAAPGRDPVGRTQMERKRYLSHREGAQREALARQQGALEESTARERTRRAARAADLQHARQKLRNKRDFVRQYDARLGKLRQENEQVRRRPHAPPRAHGGGSPQVDPRASRGLGCRMYSILGCWSP